MKMKKLHFIILTLIVSVFYNCIIIQGSQGTSNIIPAKLSSIEEQVLVETNLARTNPKEYAKKLKKLLQYYDDNLLRYPGRIPVQTEEGPSAVEEAIKYLEKVSPVSALKASKGMSLAARDHVNDQGAKGTTGHNGSDGSSPFNRMNRYGKWLSTAGENISYGQNTAIDIVIQLIVDDGVPSRGHRKNIFNNSFKVCGLAFGSHGKYGYMCVIDYAGGYQDQTE